MLRPEVNVLRTLDAEQVNQVLAQVLTRVAAPGRCGEEPSRLVEQADREAHVHVAEDSQDPARHAGA